MIEEYCQQLQFGGGIFRVVNMDKMKTGGCSPIMTVVWNSLDDSFKMEKKNVCTTSFNIMPPAADTHDDDICTCSIFRRMQILLHDLEHHHTTSACSGSANVTPPLPTAFYNNLPTEEIRVFCPHIALRMNVLSVLRKIVDQEAPDNSLSRWMIHMSEISSKTIFLVYRNISSEGSQTLRYFVEVPVVDATLHGFQRCFSFIEVLTTISGHTWLSCSNSECYRSIGGSKGLTEDSKKKVKVKSAKDFCVHMSFASKYLNTVKTASEHVTNSVQPEIVNVSCSDDMGVSISKPQAAPNDGVDHGEAASTGSDIDSQASDSESPDESESEGTDQVIWKDFPVEFDGDSGMFISKHGKSRIPQDPDEQCRKWAEVRLRGEYYKKDSQGNFIWTSEGFLIGNDACPSSISEGALCPLCNKSTVLKSFRGLFKLRSRIGSVVRNRYKIACSQVKGEEHFRNMYI